MSVDCEVCHQFHDHNIMTHIWELEAHIETLIIRLDELEKQLSPQSTSAGGP